jgi:dihydrofolate synthase / folylpolyglutamate synthase
MDYQETLDFLHSRLPMFQRIGGAAYKSSLENTLALSKLTGEPEKTLLCIHVAGTNGKGSVSHLLASILQAAGYRVGLFTSPHLKDFRERIRMNGKVVPRSYVTNFTERYRKEIEAGDLSFFEVSFAMAMSYFGDRKPDIAVIETGMGGRLDSTNIIRPVLSIITNVGWDHMAFLGDSLEKIAAEKAGIMKKHIPVIIGESRPETDKVFQAHADSVGTRLHFAEQTYKIDRFFSGIKKTPCLEMEVMKEDRVFLTKLKTPLAGLYQIKNTITVLKAVEILKKSGYSILREHIFLGFRNVIQATGIKGRWQLLRQNPLTICDTGHNPEALKEICRQLRFLPHKKLHFVFGMVNDKDISAMLEILPRYAQYYFCRPDVPRGLDTEILAAEAKEAGLQGAVFPSVRSALEAAQKEATADDLVFAGGSTFVVAEVI